MKGEKSCKSETNPKVQELMMQESRKGRVCAVKMRTERESENDSIEDEI